jgi:hypothetical protein
MEQEIHHASLILLRYIHLLGFLLCLMASIVALKKHLVLLGIGLILLAFPTAHTITFHFNFLGVRYWYENHWGTFLVLKDCIETASYTLILIHVFRAKRDKKECE